MNKVIFENKQEIVVFVEDGRLLHTHKTDLSQHPVSILGRISKARERPLRAAMSDGEI